MKMKEPEIIALIKAQSPPQNTCELAKNADKMAVDTPLFTGWKGTIDGVDLCVSGPIDPDQEWDIPVGIKVGYVAQWCAPIADGSTHKMLYVNLPGMESGAQPGRSPSKFNIGTARVYSDTPVEELNRLIEVGHAKLLDLIAQEKTEAAPSTS